MKWAKEKVLCFSVANATIQLTLVTTRFYHHDGYKYCYRGFFINISCIIRKRKNCLKIITLSWGYFFGCLVRLTVVLPEILSTDITSPTTVTTVTRSGVSMLYQTHAPCLPWATTTSLPITHWSYQKQK